MNQNYKDLYLKYKQKYLNFKKKLYGGTLSRDERKIIDTFEKEGAGQGIIIGHGIQENNFCLIPDNIILRPMTKSGSSTIINDLKDFDIDSLKKRPDRNLISEFTVKGNDYNNWYFPGSLIPNININLRTVFREETEFSFTGVITGTIYEENSNRRNSYGMIHQYINEEATKQKSLKYHDSRLLPGDIWNTNILLSDLLQKMSRNINIYTSEQTKIPKIYILILCRVGDESISFNTYEKCLRDLEEEQRREATVGAARDSGAAVGAARDPGAVVGIEVDEVDEVDHVPFSRTNSASQIDIFKNFKKLYDDVFKLITPMNENFIDKFIPDSIPKTPEIRKSIHQILQSALSDISYNIQNGLVTPTHFCMLKNLSEFKFSYGYRQLYLNLFRK